MTIAEITGLITGAVLLGSYILQIRTTSFSQFVKMNEILAGRIEDLEKSNKNKDIEIEALQEKLEASIRQNDNFKRYIARLINQLQNANIIPEKMEDYDR
jgi:hypothetical protein